MVSLAAEAELRLQPPGKWEVIRAVVFWGFILLVIASPALLGLMILLG